jgi:hypothetical protein
VSEAKMSLTDDRKRVLIDFPTSPAIQASLDASQVEQMITQLGIFRMEMMPRVPDGILAGQAVTAVPNPAWSIEGAMDGKRQVLHMRDPRFGWLHFALSRDMAKHMANVLMEGARGFSDTFLGLRH